MADPHIISTLERKHTEIERAIALYVKKIEAAKRDLSSLNSTLRLFQINGEGKQFPLYLDTARLFKRGEVASLCKGIIQRRAARHPGIGSQGHSGKGHG